MDSDLAQGGQSTSEIMFSRARVLAVKNRNALSGMLLRPGKSGEKSRAFQEALPSRVTQGREQGRQNLLRHPGPAQ